MKQSLLFKILGVFIFLSTTSTFAQLRGVYTINPSASASNTNYQNWASAIGDLVSGSRTDGGTAQGSGVRGHVTFLVSNARYNEQITFGTVTGTSDTSTITFKSASGDSSSCVVHNASSTTATNDYTFQLNGVDYVRFIEIGFERTGTNDYATVFNITNSSTNLSFTRCMFLSRFEASTSAKGFQTGIGSLVNISGATDSVLFQGNRFRRGYNGIFKNGTGNDIMIHSNIFDTTGSAAVYNTSGTRFFMTENLCNLGAFPSGSGHYVSYGLRLENCSTYSITRNRILLTNDASVMRALVFFFCASDTLNPGLIANNFIYVKGGSTNATGISIGQNTNTKIVYNNVLNASSFAGSSAFHLYPQYTSGNLDIINNSFYCSNGAYVYDVAGTNTANLRTINYNNSHTTDTTYAIWNTVNYKNRVDFNNATNHDANSISVDPVYNSISDMHVNNIALNGKATPLAYVSIDYDGQTRNGSTPDIGADEFDPITRDVAITSIDSPNYFNPGIRDVYVRIQNIGANRITKSRINWSVNGTNQTQYVWTGTLNSGNTSSLIKIGSFNFAANTPYNLVAYTLLPNDSVDLNVANDTFKVTRTARMSGNYTIGGTNPNFATINQSVVALSSRGVGGNVFFNIRDGVYNEQIRFSPVNGASSNAVITYQSQSGDSTKVTIRQSSTTATGTNNSTIQIRGASYYKLHDLTIDRTGTNLFAKVLEIIGNSHHITIENCVLRGNGLASNSVDGAVLVSDVDVDSFITARNNKIVNGTYDILFQGPDLIRERGNVFANNILDSSYASTMRILNQEGLWVEGNQFISHRSGTAITENNAIDLVNCIAGTRVEKNIINIADSDKGISLLNFNGSSQTRNRIANNMITKSRGIGIFSNGISYTDVVFNSVNLYNLGTANGNCLEANSTSTIDNINLLNNILVTANGLVYNLPVTATNTNSDYNIFFNGSSNLITYGGSTYANLSAFNVATGADSNSRFIEPPFQSNTNLRLNYNPSFARNGLAFSAVNTDIDNKTRQNPPFIGVHEFNLRNNDAGIRSIVNPGIRVCQGTYPVRAVVTNFGGNTLTASTIQWSINGTAQTSTNWTGSLTFGQNDTITLGNFNFQSGTYRVIVRTNNPNSQSDSYTDNDSFFIDVVVSTPPSANLGSNRTICDGTELTLGSSTAQPDVVYSWNAVPGGNISTSSSIKVTPSSKTKYVFTAIDTISNCETRDSVEISVDPLPTGNAGNDRTICEGDSTQIGTQVVSGQSYIWISDPAGFSSGSANPFVKPRVTTDYVVVIDNGLCTIFDTVRVNVNTLPVAIASGGVTNVCKGEIVQLGGTNQQPIRSYSWSSIPSGFSSNSATPTATPQQTTRYILQVTNTMTSCVNKDTVTITVNDLPSVSLGADINLCGGNFATIGTTRTQGISYLWSVNNDPNFSDTNATINVSPLFSSQYILTVKNIQTGCENKDTVRVFVSPGVDALASGPADVCVGSTERYVSSRVTGGHNYRWVVVGDGTIVSGANTFDARIRWNSIGNAQVSLIESRQNGCSDTFTIDVTINGKPDASLLVGDKVCVGFPISIIYPSTDGKILSYRYSGTTFTQNPSFTYTTAGNYTADFLVENNNGCLDTLSTSIEVIEKPTVSFTSADNVCRLSPISFTNSSTNATTYEWEFDDEKASNEINPVHVFEDTGTFDVRLTAINILAGCGETFTKTITVNPLPDADFSFEVIGKEFKFTPNNSKYVSYSWNFGDNTNSIETSPVKGYTETNRSFNVSLVVVDDNGCTSTLNKVVDASLLSVSSLEGVENVKIFPNPTDDQLNIKFNITKSNRVTIDLLDLTGKQIINSNSYVTNTGTQQIAIPMEHLEDGVYLLRITTQDGTLINKVIKM